MVFVYVEADLGTRMGVVFVFCVWLWFGLVVGVGLKLWEGVVLVVGVFGGAVVVMFFFGEGALLFGCGDWPSCSLCDCLVCRPVRL